jgi:hypothetical protein
MAQTSDRISSMAAKYVGMSNEQLGRKVETREGRNEVGHDIRAMAASLLRQDEVKGVRKFIAKVMGK